MRCLTSTLNRYTEASLCSSHIRPSYALAQGKESHETHEVPYVLVPTVDSLIGEKPLARFVTEGHREVAFMAYGISGK